jgi:hypothetical protein
LFPSFQFSPKSHSTPKLPEVTRPPQVGSGASHAAKIDRRFQLDSHSVGPRMGRKLDPALIVIGNDRLASTIIAEQRRGHYLDTAE